MTNAEKENEWRLQIAASIGAHDQLLTFLLSVLMRPLSPDGREELREALKTGFLPNIPSGIMGDDLDAADQFAGLAMAVQDQVDTIARLAILKAQAAT